VSCYLSDLAASGTVSLVASASTKPWQCARGTKCVGSVPEGSGTLHVLVVMPETSAVQQYK
jgi:hypothetical protein